MKNHVVVFLNNRKAYEQWKMSTLGMYHDLQITNRDIYKNLGKVIEMIGFRNIAVHAYDDLNISIL